MSKFALMHLDFAAIFIHNMRLNLFIFITIFSCLFYDVTFGAHNKNLITITEENWRNILEGEWMIEFHAPWCPACRDLRKAWEGFADWSEDLKVNIAEVDVTVSPGLSGRFLVTALPTIYHVKDGVFRQYLGSRDKDDFITFIEDKKYSSVPPLASWKHPDTYQMTLVSYFFKLSMFVRDMHNHLVEKQNIPPWASYAIFGCGILVLGCILGFFIVYLIDCLFPTALGDVATEKSTTDANKSKNKKKQTKKNVKNKDKKSDNESSDSELNVAKNSQSEGEASGNDDKTRQRKKLQNGGARKE